MTPKKMFVLWKILFLLLFLVSSGLCESINITEVIEKIENKYQKTKFFQADFIQKIYAPNMEEPSNEATGKFYFGEPCIMRWEYVTPEKQVLVLFPGIGWIYIPEEKQAQIFDTKDFYSSPIAKAFMKGIQSSFEILSWSLQEGSKTVNILMKAKEETSQIKKLELLIDISEYVISKITVEDIAGSKNVIIFTNQEWLNKKDSSIFEPAFEETTIITDYKGTLLSYGDFKKLFNTKKGDLKCRYER